MNYNYVLTTGNPLIGSGFLPPRNAEAYWNSEKFIISEEFRTGRNTAAFFVNSQAFAEETPTITQITNSQFYSINTGDLYIKTEQGFDSRQLFFEGFDPSASDFIQYDVKNQFDYGMATGTTASAMALSLFNDMVSKNMTGSSFDVFLNGQKLNSGESFTTTLSGAFPIFTMTGSVTGISGKMFCYPKKENFLEINASQPDYIGLEFDPRQLDFFINGMKQTNQDLLCLYSGVSVISSGESAQNFFYSSELVEYNL